MDTTFKDLSFVVPDSVEPVVAYRAWHLFPRWFTARDTGLTSINLTPWTPGEPLKADCLHGRHGAPTAHCSCGIYAASERHADKLVPRMPRWSVYGQVYLWGQVLEGDRGYRAEYAYPKHFFVTKREQLRDPTLLSYGVPITYVGGRWLSMPRPRPWWRWSPIFNKPLLALATFSVVNALSDTTTTLRAAEAPLWAIGGILLLDKFLDWVNGKLDAF